MKFITEEDLRSQYKKKPFCSYACEPDTKLTPGARQFLADRGMLPYDADVSQTKGVIARTRDTASQADAKGKARREKLLSSINSMEANVHEMQMCLREMKAELAALDGEDHE